jgi:hypothetical protein
LTSDLGKIDVVEKKGNRLAGLAPGVEISFTVQATYASRTLISDVEPIAVPPVTHERDVAWLHHILELYYFFMPLGAGQQEEYAFLKNYTNLALQLIDCDDILADSIRQLGILHFLAHTGFYTDERLIRYATLFTYGVADPTRLPHSKATTQGLGSMILSYLQEHPQFPLFKTVDFVYRPQVARN